MDKGKVVEKGPHGVLITQNGIYAKVRPNPNPNPNPNSNSNFSPILNANSICNSCKLYTLCQLLCIHDLLVTSGEIYAKVRVGDRNSM
jgi:hypothetical protein